MLCKRLFCVLLLASAACAGPDALEGADWPTWRGNPNRGAATSLELPATLYLQWVREYPKLETAWNDQPRMWFDKAYSPVVMGKTMFVGSSRNDSIRALDTETGAERWRFYADGPIRFAPAAGNGKLYFACDDGHLYCLDAATGTLRWRFRGGPSGRKLLGNGRLISAWPARGAPVLLDGKVYFAASIWPFMGIFIYCLDAETGKVLWANDRTGSMFALRPHHSPAFSGLAPQGYLAAVGDDLLVPNGRTTVARLDRKTGELRYHHATGSGTYHLAAGGRFFFNGGMMYETATGRRLNLRSNHPVVITDKMLYATGPYSIRAYGIEKAEVVEIEDRRGRIYHTVETKRQWRAMVPQRITSLIKAGPRLYAGGPTGVAAVEVTDAGEAKVTWQATVDSPVAELLAADSKLFVVTLGGRIYCFGGRKVPPKRHALKTALPTRWDDAWAGRASVILKRTGAAGGYCVVLGAGTGRLVEELAGRSKLHIIVIEPDAKKVTALRKRLDKDGLYGRRVVVLHGDPVTYPLPPYLANVVVSWDIDAGGLVKRGEAFAKQVLRILRPYGGVACVKLVAAQENRLAAAVRDAGIRGARVKIVADAGFERLVREGALPGAANWTHQYADASNTVVSKDDLVRAPLGLLWFGGPSNRKVLPRHGHGPSPQVVGGRLFIEGRDMLRAVDVYTGRVLWEKTLPGFGAAYDNTAHQPGANALGSNYVSLPDSVYVIHRKTCLRLDPATGRTLARFTLPKQRGEDTEATWGFLTVYKNLLIAAADPISVSALFDERNLGRSPMGGPLDGSSSERIVAMDRFTGKELWQRGAKFGFIHNTIIAGDDKVFCIDRPRVPAGLLSGGERGEPRPVPGSTLWALDARTGRLCWSKSKDIFGTWLGYSKKHDLLLQAGRPSRDMLWDEADSRMIVYRAKTGQVVWDKASGYSGPCMLHGDTLITQRKAYSLLTGERTMRKHPLTGQDAKWGFRRYYGCNTVIAAQHLLLFRSAAAGFFDLARDGGTGNFGGFKSGCTSNLIAANGVLSAPDYTRTCNCGYPNQASLALVHMPEVEMWTFTSIQWDGAPIRRMGLNLGAPGDRRSDDGTLWLEFPYAGGPTPKIPVIMVPALDPEADPGKAPGRFLKHSSRITGRGLTWVAASGMKGIRSLTIPLALPVMTVEGPDGEPVIKPRPLTERRYTVRLHFAEPDRVKPGDRVFSVSLQGRKVLADLDVVQAAGGPDRPVVREFKGVQVKDNLVITMTAGAGETLLCGVEVLADGR